MGELINDRACGGVEISPRLHILILFDSFIDCNIREILFNHHMVLTSRDSEGREKLKTYGFACYFAPPCAHSCNVTVLTI